MATAKQKLGTRTALSSASALNSLASATYASLGTVDFRSGALTPLTAKLEIAVTPGAVTGSTLQLAVFARQSMDGTNYTTGPTSGTTTTDEANLYLVGVLPLRTASTLQRGVWDLAAAFGGNLPALCEIVVKNESGVALAASGHSAHITPIDGDIA